MTAAECWTHIERHLLNRDWVGVAVLADALQDAGEKRLAGTLRWIARRERRIGYIDYEATRRRKWYCWVDIEQLCGESIPELIDNIQRHREYYQ